MLLELENIYFTKDNKEILKNINLKIDLNKFIVITGPNGSGKSTLMKLVVGIEKPTSGKILLNGEDITNYSIDKRSQLGIGYAFQHPVKFKGLTVLDILKLSNSKCTNKDIHDVLNSVGLIPEDYLTRELDDTLSGGEHKRIEIACVLIRGSLLTIFDEPEAGIDLWSFNELIKLFKRSNKLNGTTIVISHQERILNLADSLILLKDGMINKIGVFREVIGEE